MSWRMKSKSGWLAAGKPTSISLNPMSTTASNMRSLRAGSIGSISAWLPSRRSTEHHSGALSITRFGHVRSVSTSGTNGAYLEKDMALGVTGGGGMAHLLRKRKNPPAGAAGGGRDSDEL